MIHVCHCQEACTRKVNSTQIYICTKSVFCYILRYLISDICKEHLIGESGL